MSLVITVAGVDYTVPSSAADTNWAAQVIAFWQALAAAIEASADDVVLLTTNQDVHGTKSFLDGIVAAVISTGQITCSGIGEFATLAGTWVDLPAGDGTASTGGQKISGGLAGVEMGEVDVTIEVAGMSTGDRVQITPIQIDASVHSWAVTDVSDGEFTVTLGASCSADFFFNWQMTLGH